MRGLPPGWKAEWSAEQNQRYFVNIYTNESTWEMPKAPAPTTPTTPAAPYQPNNASSHGVQQYQPQEQRPSGNQAPQFSTPAYVQDQVSPQAAYNGPVNAGHVSSVSLQYRKPISTQYIPPTPSPQQDNRPLTTQYFPPPQVEQQRPQSTLYYSTPPSQHQHQQQQQHQQPQSTQYYPPPPSQQQQQRQPQPAPYYPPPQAQQQQQQQQQSAPTHYYPPPPGSTQQIRPQSTASPTPPVQYQEVRSQPAQYFTPPPGNVQYPSPPVPYQQGNDSGQSMPAVNPQQYPQNGAYHGPQVPSPHPSYQSQQSNLTKTSAKPQNLTDKSAGMMGKLGNKFGKLQKSAAGASKADLKKWGTRAAIGLGAIGALALGVDAIDGGLFDGAGADTSSMGGDFSFGGGEDFSGGGGDVALDSTAVDASYAQLAMEAQGQENALMLLDPVGTEYVMVDGSANTGVSSLI